jgi:guanylate kinase
MSKGRLFVISGPSAVGKGTIVKEIMDSSDSVSLSVSATTREPREGETDGIDYYFLTEEEFKDRIENDGFLEYAYVHGHYYGTPKAPVLEKLSQGCDIILEIDVQGAMKVKESFDSAAYIFILPPSIEELHNRIMKRGTESQEDVELRMSKALGEIEYLDKYDYFVINNDVENAVDTLRVIMRAEHQKTEGNAGSLLRRYKGGK